MISSLDFCISLTFVKLQNSLGDVSDKLQETKDREKSSHLLTSLKILLGLESHHSSFLRLCFGNLFPSHECVEHMLTPKHPFHPICLQPTAPGCAFLRATFASAGIPCQNRSLCVFFGHPAQFLALRAGPCKALNHQLTLLCNSHPRPSPF